MAAEALPHCRRLGIRKALITCSMDNVASRRGVEANSGVLQDVLDQAHHLVQT